MLELDERDQGLPGRPAGTGAAGGDLQCAARGSWSRSSGPSGSGKTTLLHLMGTLDRPTSGSVRVTGLDVARIADRELPRCAPPGSGSSSSSSSWPSSHERPRQRGRRAALCRRLPQASAGGAPSSALERGRAGPHARMPGRPSSRAASASGSRSPGRSSGSPAIVLADEPTGNLDSATGAVHPGPAGGAQPAGRDDHGDHPRPSDRRPHAPPARDARRHDRRRHGPARTARPAQEGRHDRIRTARARPGGCALATWPGSPASGCAPASCAPGCRLWASPSAWRPSSPCSVCPRPPRPACWPRSTGSAPTC